MQTFCFIGGGVDGGNPWGEASRSLSPLLPYELAKLDILIIVRALLV